METRRLGRLGHMSSVLIFGGAALAEADDEAADRSIAFALESGINHFDTAAAYGDSEIKLGRWMDRMRDDIFLATKTGDREKGAAAASIRRSLERLRTDRVDLIQIHAVVDIPELDVVTRSGGALEAAVEARDEGLAGAIGITGHGMEAPATHLEALRRFPFDTVLTPFNYRLAQYPEYRRDYEALTEEIAAQDAGLMVIKAVARNLWRTDRPPERTTWYEPFEEQRHVDASIAFALAQPHVTGIATPGDVALLPGVVVAEKRASSMTMADIDDAFADVSEYESPFVSHPGRSLPEWWPN
ncbi:MAG TPA: aldo/keto reductase [Actinomycetota bacterium]|nr:aldo/keto reductase [Actinomycetota bacterium]